MAGDLLERDVRGMILRRTGRHCWRRGSAIAERVIVRTSAFTTWPLRTTAAPLTA